MRTARDWSLRLATNAALVCLANTAWSLPEAGDTSASGSSASGTSASFEEAPGQAGSQAETGFEHGLRLGFELPLGDIDEGASIFGGGLETRSGTLGGVAAFRVPVSLDLGYRVTPRWWFGAEAGLGLGPAGDDCPDSATCEWSSVRFGAQALFSPSPNSDLAPWLALGLGYEWLEGSVSQDVEGVQEDEDVVLASIEAEEKLSGPLLSLSAGLLFDVGEQLRMGPYLSGAAGMYLFDSYDCPSALGCPDGDRTRDPGLHAWLGLGVRGTHGP